MASVGVRELRDRLSDYLRRVRDGELLVITDRGKPIGELSPVERRPILERARTLVRRGMANWSGGKPKGLSNPPRSRGRSVADAVLEGRR